MIGYVIANHLILCVYCSNYQKVIFDNNVEISKIERTFESLSALLSLVLEINALEFIHPWSFRNHKNIPLLYMKWQEIAYLLRIMTLRTR